MLWNCLTHNLSHGCNDGERIIVQLQAEAFTNQQHSGQDNCHSTIGAQLCKQCQELGGKLALAQVQLQVKSSALDTAEAALSAVKADQVGNHAPAGYTSYHTWLLCSCPYLGN